MLQFRSSVCVAVLLSVISADAFLPDRALTNPDPGHKEWVEEKAEEIRLYKEQKPLRLAKERTRVQAELAEPPVALVDTPPVAWKSADGASGVAEASERAFGGIWGLWFGFLLGLGWFWYSRHRAKVSAGA